MRKIDEISSGGFMLHMHLRRATDVGGKHGKHQNFSYIFTAVKTFTGGGLSGIQDYRKARRFNLKAQS